MVFVTLYKQKTMNVHFSSVLPCITTFFFPYGAMGISECDLFFTAPPQHPLPTQPVCNIIHVGGGRWVPVHNGGGRRGQRAHGRQQDTGQGTLLLVGPHRRPHHQRCLTELVC